MIAERGAVLLGLLALTVACGSDDEPLPGCDAMACDDSLMVAFEARQAGDYSFQVVADGQVTSCAATLPLQNCAQTLFDSNCSRGDVRLVEGGCNLVPEAHRLVGITFHQRRPATLEITASRDDVEIARETFTPEYQRVVAVAPNGEECGRSCEQATVDFAIP